MKNQAFVFIVVLFLALAILACGSSGNDIGVNELSGENGNMVQETINTDSDIPESESTETEIPTETKSPTTTPEPTATPELTATQEPTVTKNPYVYKAGTYLVGNEIIQGRYVGQAGYDIMDSCYWARLSDLSGSFNSIIANENAIGQFYIDVKESDMALEIHCVVTHIDGVPTPEDFKKELNAGTYLVGRDIEAGLYKGQAGEDIMDSCYWARLKDVSGSFGSIISNDNATGQFYVQVLPSDFALTVHCPVTYQEE